MRQRGFICGQLCFMQVLILGYKRGIIKGTGLQNIINLSASWVWSIFIRLYDQIFSTNPDIILSPSPISSFLYLAYILMGILSQNSYILFSFLNNIYNINMDCSFISDNRDALKQNIKDCKNSIEGMLKQFKYQQNLTIIDNMRKLCTCLENIMDVECLEDFGKFLSSQEHLPIEVNLKALKYENLVEIFEDWLNSIQDHPANFQRNMSHKHRNILFKQIFLEEKETIQDFFQTISQKQKLRGMDLYQLLMNILSPYVLYEYYSDTQSFFSKTNTFENFMKVVNAFIKNARRVYVKDKNDPNDQDYIRLHEFEQLIEFWENFNPELTLQEQPRKNKIDIGIQTTEAQTVVNSQTQTDKQSARSYLSVINSTLYEINSMISKQNDPQMLASLDILFDALRSQKLFAINYQQRNKSRFRKRSHGAMLESNYSQSRPILQNQKERTMSSNKNKVLSRKTVQNARSMNEVRSFSPHKYEEDLKIIYSHLCNKDSMGYLTLSELQIFLYDVGLTKAHENTLVKNILSHGCIEDKEDITLKQFKNIIIMLMQQSKKLNPTVLKNYISNIQDLQELRGTAHFKTNSSPRNNTTNFSKSEFANVNRSLLRKDSIQGTSRTTFLLDSDGSYM